MRTSTVARLAVLCVASVVTLSSCGDSEPGSLPQPLATYSPPPQDHVEDYSAPASELIDHIDHLDLDRLPPSTRAELEAELARRAAVAESLWAAYGDLVAGDPQADPTFVRGLPVYELAYVLVAARAEQLAAAVARTGSLAAARANDKDHADVTATQSGTCVTVVYAKDPLSRAFGAVVGAHVEGPLIERLERSVRVDAAGSPACSGTRVALSPAVVAALGG